MSKMNNSFVFADLSTYDLNTTANFYAKVFDWNFPDAASAYLVAHYQGKEVCGIYEMPQKFKGMKMPSFWMSYIQVEDIDAAVEKARSLGGIIELVDKNQAIGKIALIRDPLGAGFTVYEGDSLHSRYEDEPNALVWNELFISDFTKVLPFYQGVFNWQFEKIDDGRVSVLNGEGSQIGAINELDEKIKGNKEYWSVFFGSRDTSKIKSLVVQNGGSVLYEDANQVVCSDPVGAFFHVVAVKDGTGATESKGRGSMGSGVKWRAILGLLLVGLSLLTGWLWVWGLFFAFWVISDLRSGFTHLFEPVSKRDNPLLYWTIIGMWVFLSGYSLFYYTNDQMLSGRGDMSGYENSDGSFFRPLSFKISNPETPNQAIDGEMISDSEVYEAVFFEGEEYVGIETELIGDRELDGQYVDELWQYFASNDISSYIDYIEDDRVYMIYSDFDESIESYSKVLLGYQVSSIDQLFEGLSFSTIPASRYAVFKSEFERENPNANNWNDASSLGLIGNGKNALEVYSFNEDNDLDDVELRIEL
ncbi:MAG: effector binding domain-containing protein [Bacteroidota bacterium]